MKSDILYPTKLAREILRVSNTRLQYLVLKQITSPEDKSLGTGSTRKFSFSNIMEMGIANQLASTKIPIEFVRSIILLSKEQAPYLFTLEMEDVDRGSSDSNTVLCVKFLGGLDHPITIEAVIGSHASIQCDLSTKLIDGSPYLVIDLGILSNRLRQELRSRS